MKEHEGEEGLATDSERVTLQLQVEAGHIKPDYADQKVLRRPPLSNGGCEGYDNYIR